ncbi:hypothetical protein EI427_23860 [Flammeovirga pectinis]|uniref:SusD-like N-terminal domain-containing protein n=1 Tax=Flammeovirga pectinis TaxID=2494373 RepID=A0A3Q9FQ01_9BACT|nr:RagB/SusD family nutrient uptake outer membrane protein [Flammeovirga pectinis]AZQ65253.1 hypothetical protein EI427_23860 [Flammeovirga pectinis]
MNTFNKIIATTLAAGSLLMSGCNPDDFLTEVNPNAITEDTFWKTEGDAEAALTTVYAALQYPCISGGNLTYEMAKSDIVGTNDWTRHFSFTEFTTADNEHAVLGTWAELYSGIFRANQVIDNIPTMEALSEERKIEIVAQAKFLRAFYYFNLIHTYGQAVIKLDSKATNHNIGLSTQQDVQEQVILPDLEYAIEHLPILLESQQLGRVARGAAITLLGKTYLYNQEWDLAAAEFKKVIDSGLYTLVPNFMDNFRGDIAFNSESIFEVPYDGSINPGTANADMTDDDPNNSGGESSGMSRTYGPYSLGGGK